MASYPRLSCNSRLEALNRGFGHCLLSLWYALIARRIDFSWVDFVRVDFVRVKVDLIAVDSMKSWSCHHFITPTMSMTISHDNPFPQWHTDLVPFPPSQQSPSPQTYPVLQGAGSLQCGASHALALLPLEPFLQIRDKSIASKKV